jgi:hypothetical protein
MLEKLRSRKLCAVTKRNYIGYFFYNFNYSFIFF